MKDSKHEKRTSTQANKQAGTMHAHSHAHTYALMHVHMPQNRDHNQ